jgi:hypothetical protein
MKHSMCIMPHERISTACSTSQIVAVITLMLLETPEPIVMDICTYAMPPEPIPTANLMNPFHE